MPEPDAIAQRAMELATTFLEEDGAKLAGMADGDPGALREAARILREQPQQQAKASISPEHLAFTLITAAYQRLLGDPEAEGGGQS
jgi:hypothetical protein